MNGTLGGKKVTIGSAAAARSSLPTVKQALDRLPLLARDRSSLGAMANALAHESSPYLLQHRDNPVDWRPWGPEALALARELDRPLLVSIGYSACHWCHVMERESFEDPAVAAIMNDNFVCVKVDREERPDIDAIAMEAVQLMTGHGGWPLNVFLTPDQVPFYGGTYFPPEPRHGMAPLAGRAGGGRSTRGPSSARRSSSRGRGWPSGWATPRRCARPRAVVLGTEPLDDAVRNLRAALRHHQRRLRRRAEVPAVLGAAAALGAGRARRLVGDQGG